MSCKNHPLIEDRLTRCARCVEAFCPDCIVEIGGLPHCLECKTESLRDLLSGLPVGELDLASIGRRFAALVLDALVIVVPVYIVAVLLLLPRALSGRLEQSAIPLLGNILVNVSVAVILVLYEALMLASGGQTVGKKAMNIKVVSAEGGEISLGQAWGRALARRLLSFFCLWPINYLFAFRLERTCLHDMMAKTRVVNWG